MALDKVKPNAGSGGKRGHSNMTHWSKTELVKRTAKNWISRGGGMVDAGDLKSPGSNPMWVRSPPPALVRKQGEATHLRRCAQWISGHAQPRMKPENVPFLCRTRRPSCIHM